MKQVHVPMYEPLEISVVSTQELPVNMTMDLNNAFVSVSIFFWLTTRAGHILAAEIAERRNSTRFTASVRLQDPGVFEVHALVVHREEDFQQNIQFDSGGGKPQIPARPQQSIQPRPDTAALPAGSGSAEGALDANSKSI